MSDLLTILDIFFFCYFGTGILFVVHVACTEIACRQVTRKSSVEQAHEAAQWFEIVSGQRGGIWGMMGLLLLNPLHFLEIGRSTNQ